MPDWSLWVLMGLGVVLIALSFLMSDHEDDLEAAFERARQATPEGPSPIRVLEGIDIPLGPYYDFDAMSLSRKVHHKMPKGFVHSIFGPVERCACNNGHRVP